MRHHRNSSAFSLIEVVLALAVASFSLIAIIALLGVAAGSSKASSDDTLVATMAVSVIDDMSKLYFVDNGTLTPHHITDTDILPGTSDVPAGTTSPPTPATQQIYFDVAGSRLSTSIGGVYLCTVTILDDVTTLSATGTDGSTSTQAVNLVNVRLTFTWPAQAANPTNSKDIYASIARY